MKIEKPVYMKFFVPMKPQPLQRTRSTKTGFHYTPQKSRDAKAQIAYFGAEYMRKQGFEEPIEGYFDVKIWVYLAKPKNWFENKLPFTGGDWDNHGKTVSDALNGVIWLDDRYIRMGTVIKDYGDAPGYTIKITAFPLPEKPRKRRRKEVKIMAKCPGGKIKSKGKGKGKGYGKGKGQVGVPKK